MNKKQRIAIIMGMFLVFLSGLFPAYEGEYRTSGDNLKKNIGHHFILSPPTQEDTMKLFGHSASIYNPLERYSAKIISSQYYIQIFTILLLTIGTVSLFKDK